LNFWTKPHPAKVEEEIAMDPLKRFRWLCVAAVVSVAAVPQGVAAQSIIKVIDIRPIIALGSGNAMGLAFDPTANVLYLGQDSGSIYTLDLDGHLLDQHNLHATYKPDSFPISLTFDGQTGHLFVHAGVFTGQVCVDHLVEMTPDGETVFGDLTLGNCAEGGPLIVREDGLWQTRFGDRALRHLTKEGAFIEDVSLAGEFPAGFPAGAGFPGPTALASSFSDGFFVVDHFGRRLLEFDRSGNAVGVASTTALGDGRGLAVSADSATERIFLQINNEDIYVLSHAFLRNVVNRNVSLTAVVKACDPSPLPAAPGGTCVLRATFRNSSSEQIVSPAFFIIDLSGIPQLADPLLLNADGGPGGSGATVTPDIGGDGKLAPGESFTAEFVIGVKNGNRFRLLVDVLGTLAPADE
jgi:hypothetical protein